MQTHTAKRTVTSGDQAFYHLSLHSRHVAMPPRQEVLSEIVDILLPIARNSCGMVRACRAGSSTCSP